MTGTRKYQPALTSIAAIFVLGVSLGVAQAAASQPVTAKAGGKEPRSQALEVAAATSRVQSNKIKYRNLGSRTTVKPGQKNTLSPQPLPPRER